LLLIWTLTIIRSKIGGIKMTKKITRVEGGETSATKQSTGKPFVASDESKTKARTFRILAIVSWIVAIAFEVVAILQLKSVPINTTDWILLLHKTSSNFLYKAN
jgi:hypothetical protein